MSEVKAQIAVSLDGYMAGPNQSEENPLGEGGMDLHRWFFALDAEDDASGSAAAPNPSRAVIAAAQADVGAVVMGRNMFGPIRGEWGDTDWNGWWGDEPPYHAPVFVLTHHPREPVPMAGGTTFNFVTDGIESAVAAARAAAGEQDVLIGGGAATLHQAIAAGQLDEIVVHQVPFLLGAGERLFDGLPVGAARFELAATVPGPEALHLTYRVSA